MHWKASGFISTYRAGGPGHAGIFDIVPWDRQWEPSNPQAYCDLCNAYQAQQVDRAEFETGLRRLGAPPCTVDRLVAMVEAKGMAPAPPLESPDGDAALLAAAAQGDAERVRAVLGLGVANREARLANDFSGMLQRHGNGMGTA